MDYDLDRETENGQAVDFTTIPPGTYLVQVAEVRQGFTRNGDERWSMRLVVAEGEYIGRIAAWDSLVFSLRGNSRVRHVFGAMGMPTRGKVTLHPDDLVGKKVFVDVRPSEYTPPGGEKVRRNEVPYTGYLPLDEPDGDRSTGSADSPSKGHTATQPSTGADARAETNVDDRDLPF